VIQQGYDTARKFRSIDQESLKELFGNVFLDVMATIKKQNLRALRAFLLDCNRDQIDLTLFDADALEMQQESLSTERAASSKADSDKSQDKPPVWDGDIFKMGVWLKKFHAWMGLKKNG